jgi:hypothetical protein
LGHPLANSYDTGDLATWVVEIAAARPRLWQAGNWPTPIHQNGAYIAFALMAQHADRRLFLPAAARPPKPKPTHIRNLRSDFYELTLAEIG